MISAKKLIRMARKWQKLAAIRRTRISLPRTTGGADAYSCSTSSVANKGHFVVYTADQRRFVLPLVYLNNGMIRELFKLAEEEYGMPSNGPLTLPCDAALMEYVVALIQRHVTKDLEALLLPIATGRCSSSSYLHRELTNQQLQICSF